MSGYGGMLPGQMSYFVVLRQEPTAPGAGPGAEVVRRIVRYGFALRYLSRCRLQTTAHMSHGGPQRVSSSP